MSMQRKSVLHRAKIATRKSTRAARSTESRARLFLVDDHPLVRHGFTQLVNEQPDLCICGEAGSFDEAMQILAVELPDLVVLDLSLPGRDGMEIIHEFTKLCPRLPILVLSMRDEMFYAERVLRAGGKGYIMKHEPSEQVLTAIRSVLRGEIYVSPPVSAHLMQEFAGRHSRFGCPGMQSLSERELQVFEAIGGGLSTRQIGVKYGISGKTVETHRCHIKHKLGLDNNHELVHAAMYWEESEAAGQTVAEM